MLLYYMALSVTILCTGILCETCESNWNCTGNAICHNGQCECDAISYLSEDKCIPRVTEYRGHCIHIDQCEWLGNNADCRKNICVCGESYMWYQGKCQRYAGFSEYCDESIMCYDGMNPLAMQCDSNVCICSAEYYNRGNDCRKKIEDNSCSINYDCEQSTNSTKSCSHGKCIEKNKSSQENTDQLDKSLIEDNEENTLAKYPDNYNCTRDSDCKSMANSVCDAGTRTCQCRNNYFENKGNCLPGFAVCEKNDTCSSSLANSYCFHGICVCRQGYFYSQNMCIAEIGMPANITNDGDCEIKTTKSEGGACFCIKFWFGDEYNRQCFKSIVQDNLRCTNDYWCNTMGPYSFCNSSQLCQCSSFSVLDEETFYCNEEDPIPKDFCSRDSSCGYNKRCHNEQCICNEKFSDVNGECLPDLGGSCGIEDCFHIENSSCLDGICTCNTEYVSYNNQCLAKAEHWDDACEVSEQCQKLKFTECSKLTKKCKCMEGFEKVEEKCWESKDYGYPCMTSTDCTKVLNQYYVCRNNKCLCPIGQVLEKGYCVNSISVSLLSSTYLIIVLIFAAILI